MGFWNDLVKAVVAYGDPKAVFVLIAILLYPTVSLLVKLLKPIVDAWLKERETFITEVTRARESVATLANNHVAHLQCSLEQSHEKFLNTQKEIVDMQKLSNQTAQETVRALERMQETNLVGFSEIRQSMTQMTRDILQRHEDNGT